MTTGESQLKRRGGSSAAGLGLAAQCLLDYHAALREVARDASPAALKRLESAQERLKYY